MPSMIKQGIQCLLVNFRKYSNDISKWHLFDSNFMQFISIKCECDSLSANHNSKWLLFWLRWVMIAFSGHKDSNFNSENIWKFHEKKFMSPNFSFSSVSPVANITWQTFMKSSKNQRNGMLFKWINVNHVICCNVCWMSIWYLKTDKRHF